MKEKPIQIMHTWLEEAVKQYLVLFKTLKKTKHWSIEQGKDDQQSSTVGKRSISSSAVTKDPRITASGITAHPRQYLEKDIHVRTVSRAMNSAGYHSRARVRKTGTLCHRSLT